jgi:hypothetical protein
MSGIHGALLLGQGWDGKVFREVGSGKLGQGSISREQDSLSRVGEADTLTEVVSWYVQGVPNSEMIIELSTHTLQGPAVPLTSTPSSVRITTHTLDPPPSAQRTSEGGTVGGVGSRDMGGD